MRRIFIVYYFIFNPNRLSVWSKCSHFKSNSIVEKRQDGWDGDALVGGWSGHLMVTLNGTCCQDLRSQSSIHQDPEWRPDSSFSLREIMSNDVMTTALYSLGVRPEDEHSIFTTCSCQQRFPSVTFSTKMAPHLPITKCTIAPPAGSGLYHLCRVLANLLFTGSDSFYRAF